MSYTYVEQTVCYVSGHLWQVENNGKKKNFSKTITKRMDVHVAIAQQEVPVIHPRYCTFSGKICLL